MQPRAIQTKAQMKRNESIDILKGIGIILVLVAHSLGGIISKFAYTFHMPLFFIIVGLFIKIPDQGTSIGGAVKKDFKRLIIPAIFTTVFIVVFCSLHFLFPDSYLPHPKELLLKGDTGISLDSFYTLGNLWFLFALFWGKTYFYLVTRIHKTIWMVITCFVLGLIAVTIGKTCVLPYGITIGFSILPFIVIGYLLRMTGFQETGKISKRMYLCIPLWMVYLFFGELRVGIMQYRWGYIPDIFAACGGTMLFYIISREISKRCKITNKVLAFLGRHSLILICMPTIETYCFPMQEIIPELPFRSMFVIAGKVIWCAASLYACIKIPFLKRIFGVR